MQVSGAGGGHVSVAAQQGMYANFQHQGTPSPQHHQGKPYRLTALYYSKNLQGKAQFEDVILTDIIDVKVTVALSVGLSGTFSRLNRSIDCDEIRYEDI